jgi:hypothetical protein
MHQRTRCIPDLPQHVTASGCHLHGVIGVLEAAQVISVLWAYTDYTDTTLVASKAPMTPCRWQPLAETCWDKSGIHQ